MSALWTAEAAAGATGGHIAPEAAWSVDGVSIDTRSVASRDLFVALKGPRFDGHDFVGRALSDGAAAAMVDRAIPDVDPMRLLAVDDTMAGLNALAVAARARSNARVVAVTGSVGKTGTKEALARVFGAQGPTHASAGNLNNHIGTPLSLSRLPPSARYAVFELGMNHAGEIEPLSKMVRPHAAIITTVDSTHLEFFANVEGIADAKAEIFAGLEPGGTAILNRDNPYFSRMAARAATDGVGRVWSFGEARGADAQLLSVSLGPDGSVAEARVLGRAISFSLPLPGRHHVQNALAVLLAVAALDGDLAVAATTLGELSAVKGRGTLFEITLPGGSFRLIDESYNASPVAMRAALSVLGMTTPGPGGRRIAVFGDMLELGRDAPALHAELAGAIIAAGVERTFTAGPLSRHLHDALPADRRGRHAADIDSLGADLAADIRAGDIVLVKGSAGSRMSAVVAALKALDRPAGGMRDAV